MIVEFTCPDCGNHRIEEIMYGVVVSSRLNIISVDTENLDGPADLVYGNQSNDDGVIVRFQCLDCQYILLNDDGYPVTSNIGLNRWMVENKQDKQCGELPV